MLEDLVLFVVFFLGPLWVLATEDLPNGARRPLPIFGTVAEVDYGIEEDWQEGRPDENDFMFEFVRQNAQLLEAHGSLDQPFELNDIDRRPGDNKNEDDKQHHLEVPLELLVLGLLDAGHDVQSNDDENGADVRDGDVRDHKVEAGIVDSDAVRILLERIHRNVASRTGVREVLHVQRGRNP